MISPTYLQDQKLLRDFYRLPDGEWFGFRAAFRDLVNQRLEAAGYLTRVQPHWKIRRNGSRFEFQSQLGHAELILDFASVAEGQSLTLALTFAFAFSFTFALSFTFAFDFAIEYDFGEPGGSFPHDCHYSWDQFQATLPQIRGQTAGFRLGDNQSIQMAGKINPDNTVDLTLHGISPTEANHILALLRK